MNGMGGIQVVAPRITADEVLTSAKRAFDDLSALQVLTTVGTLVKKNPKLSDVAQCELEAARLEQEISKLGGEYRDLLGRVDSTKTDLARTQTELARVQGLVTDEQRSLSSALKASTATAHRLQIEHEAKAKEQATQLADLHQQIDSARKELGRLNTEVHASKALFQEARDKLLELARVAQG